MALPPDLQVLPRRSMTGLQGYQGTKRARYNTTISSSITSQANISVDTTPPPPFSAPQCRQGHRNLYVTSPNPDCGAFAFDQVRCSALLASHPLLESQGSACMLAT